MNAAGLSPPETIETNRLRLRCSTEADAEGVFAAYAQDREVTSYLAWQPTGKIEDTRESLRHAAEEWRQGKAFRWTIFRKTDHRLMGTLAARVDGLKLELGYVLAKEFWGHGFMTEAVRAIVDWALQQKEIYRVWAVCDVENPASARVLEKVGMTREGILRRWSVHPTRSAEPRDCICYAITK